MELGQGALEVLVNINSEFWQGRRVLVTGHTGFKGSWLSIWLKLMGARLYGYALDPLTDPALFEISGLSSQFELDIRQDIASLNSLGEMFEKVQPEIIFHLAAQPLVKTGYEDPLQTLATNVIGTAHVLQAARSLECLEAIVVITTDKVYRNLETGHAYNESDALGGHDPYSASKAAAEIVTESYRLSFFSGTGSSVATARAGNVIGGGDWSSDRLIPDCLKAFADNRPVILRNPDAVRPWQHVLDPLGGYLMLAEALCGQNGNKYEKAWNFGPDLDADAPVNAVAETMAGLWGNTARIEYSPETPAYHEAGLLHLDSLQAHKQLLWKPRLPLDVALEFTVDWYKSWLGGKDMYAYCQQQILSYLDMA